MKTLVAFILIICSTGYTCAQQMTSGKWKEDLQFLSETIHNDYGFLFRKTDKEIFDAEVSRLADDIPQLEDFEIVAALKKLIASFEYGHTALSAGKGSFAFRQLPMNLYQFGDDIYIEGIRAPYEQDLGARLKAIEEVPVEEVVRGVYPYFPAENSQFFKGYGLHYLITPEILAAAGITKDLKDSIQLTLEKDDKTYQRYFKPMKKGERPPLDYGWTREKDDWFSVRPSGPEVPLYLANLDKKYSYTILPDQKALYVQQNEVQDDSLQVLSEFYMEVMDTVTALELERLIIDVRLNGGGNNYKNKDVIKEIIRNKQIDKIGALFVILGRRTFSACQNLVNEFDNYTNVVFVGEPTGENINFYGDNREVSLPNSQLKAYLSFAWWQDKPQWENGPWMAPHLSEEVSFEDFRNNRDPVLETALSFNDESFILDPMDYLTELFMRGEVDLVRSETKRFIDDPRYAYTDFEGQFNRAGNNLLQDNRFKEATFVFGLITEHYPDNAEGWFGLGTALNELGDTESSEKCFQQSIQFGDTKIKAKAKEALDNLKQGK
ncbi:tetratricopeptide repeat protein [Robertkochia aurantiaca]|uniref:tetratricopeptide repeat protein n=1 Tax=Robertkochia aurantiaca TaxID=2873700 RepID=UPI001CCCCC18|nr:hypothetical protein [Robertkochia sp. 3YJGBD-33]